MTAKYLKNLIWQTLEHPRTRSQKYLYYFLNTLVVLSLLILLTEIFNHDFFHNNHNWFSLIEIFILTVFVANFTLLYYAKPGRKYIFTLRGFIDVLAILPSLILIAFGLEAVIPTGLVKFFKSFHLLHSQRFLK